MLSLGENEKILVIVRKHWFVMAGPVLFLIALLILPFVAFFLVPYLRALVNEELLTLSVNFFAALYLASVLAFLFFEWVDYYLDTWIITSRRIIDIEQNGLFDRSVSEIPLSRVQDITIEVKGIIETLLQFGTIRIQTAGERDFFINDVPHLQTLKTVILAEVDKERGGATPGVIVTEK